MSAQSGISRADIARLRSLWERLPNADCNGCDACGEKCAGDIPMTRWEFEQIQSLVAPHDLRMERRPSAQHAGPFAAPCRFRDGEVGRCRIYPARPLICRLFGLVEWLPCPLRRWGVRQPNGIDIMRWYATLGPRPYEHWLQAGARNVHTEA